MDMKVTNVGYKTDIGRVRKNNEDRLHVDEKIGLFIVADGMGGHQSGEVASAMAVDIISSEIAKTLERNNIPVIIHKSIEKANREIYNKANKDINLNGMGTTVVLSLCHEDKIYIAHVGDSKAYLIRDGAIIQLTQDHSLVAELLKAGEITEEDVRRHHLRHVVTKVLGSKEFAEPDIMTISPQDGDYFLLCTDGLTEMVRDEEIRDAIINVCEPQKICEELICLANKNGGKDNISVILIAV